MRLALLLLTLIVTATPSPGHAADPGAGLGGTWRVIVCNDDHNTFDGVAEALSQTIPGVSLSQGYALADLVHRSGQAIVWSGEQELAQGYWEQLSDFGLTMAPLERG